MNIVSIACFLVYFVNVSLSHGSCKPVTIFLFLLLLLLSSFVSSFCGYSGRHGNWVTLLHAKQG